MNNNIKLWKVSFNNNIAVKVEELNKIKETKSSVIVMINDKRITINNYFIAKPKKKNGKVFMYVNAETEQGAKKAGQYFLDSFLIV